MATIHGKNGAVYLQGSGTDAILIAESAEWTIDIDYDTEPDPAMGDTWETRLKGLMRAKGTIAGNFDTAQAGNALWESVGGTTSTLGSRKMYLYPDRSVSGRYYYGNVWPKLGANMPIGRGSFSATWENDGQIALN